MGYMVWLIAFVALAGIELVTMGMTSIWFACGALAAMVVALLGGNALLQWICFLAVSILVLVLLRPFAVRYINRRREKTNVESMAGKTGRVSEQIQNVDGKGAVNIDGMSWSAKSVDDSVIEEGELVDVVRVEGVKVIVQRADKAGREEQRTERKEESGPEGGDS